MGHCIVFPNRLHMRLLCGVLFMPCIGLQGDGPADPVAPVPARRRSVYPAAVRQLTAAGPGPHSAPVTRPGSATASGADRWPVDELRAPAAEWPGVGAARTWFGEARGARSQVT